MRNKKKVKTNVCVQNAIGGQADIQGATRVTLTTTEGSKVVIELVQGAWTLVNR